MDNYKNDDIQILGDESENMSPTIKDIEKELFLH